MYFVMCFSGVTLIENLTFEFLLIIVNLHVRFLLSFVVVVMVCLTSVLYECGSLTVTCRTCNPEVTQGCRFDSAPGHCRVTDLRQVVHTHVPLSPSSIIWYRLHRSEGRSST